MIDEDDVRDSEDRLLWYVHRSHVKTCELCGSAFPLVHDCHAMPKALA